MKKRELSESERHVIIDKGTEMPFSGKYWNNRRPVHTSAVNAELRSTGRQTSSMPDAAGQVSTTRYRRGHPPGPMPTASVPKSSVRPAEAISATSLPAKDSPRRTPATASIPYRWNSFRRHGPKPQTATKRLFSPEGVSGVWNTTCKRHPALSPLNRAIRAAASRHLLTKRYAATARAMLKRYGSPSTRRRPLTKRSPASFLRYMTRNRSIGRARTSAGSTARKLL